MDIENLDPGESSVIDDNNEVILDKDEEECTGASSGKEERSNNEDKGKRFMVEIKLYFSFEFFFKKNINF